MSDTPQTTNQTATTANSVINAAGASIVKVTEAMIIADVPFLATPVIKQIWEAVYNWIASYFIKASELGATFVIIDAQVSSEQSRMAKAIAGLLKAQKSGDQNAIQAAIKEYADAQSSLVHYDGSATPR